MAELTHHSRDSCDFFGRPPPLPSRHFQRRRLAEWIATQPPSTVVVTAPAWFGKTTLLRAWFDRFNAKGVHTVWISARETGGSCAALSGVIGTTTLKNSSIAVFIDDTPSLSTELQAELSALIRDASEQCVFVLSSRGDLPNGLSSAWTHGRTQLFTDDDIALSTDEIESMAQAAGVPIDRSDCEALLEATAGWMGAVKLTLDAYDSHRDSDKTPIASFHRIRNILFRVIEESSLESISLETRDFLEKVCILDTLTIPLCRAVAAVPDCSDHLKRLKSNGAFIHEYHSKPNVYHLNPLLRELLARRLESQGRTVKNTLHERASRWYAENGQITEALEHGALTGDPTFLASTLERFCEEMIYRGEIHRLEKYAAELPPVMLRTLPRLSLAISWWRTRQYRFVEAEELIQSVKDFIAPKRRSKQTQSPQNAELVALLKHRELTLRSGRSAMPISDEECQGLIADFAKTNNNGLQLNLFVQLFASYRRQYRMTEILKFEAQASELAERCGNVTFTPWLRAELGAAYVECGRITIARRLFEKSLEDASRFEGVRAGLSALSGLYVADLCYEADDRVNASRLIETHLPAAREFGLVDQLVTAYTVKAKLSVAEDDMAGAIATLDDGIRFSEERQLDRLGRCLQGEKVRMFSALGTPTSFDEIASPPSGKRIEKHSDLEIHDAATARILLSRSQHTEALRLANSWISFCVGNLAVRTLTRWQLIRTHALLLSGDIQNARRALREALTSAAKGGFLRKMVDSAPPVRALLLEVYDGRTAQNNEIEVFAQRAIRIISKNLNTASIDHVRPLGEGDSLSGVLTTKEREILTLVAGGLQNREIGERLGITEGTVKWHMQQIFTKLGVRRRAHAISAFRTSSGLP
jgi:LuxR family transcriptional regulator, maltose regulon positive regulatory protein